MNMKSSAICFSLQVLETCMKNCGGTFHSEVAKFKFLNELVKVISTNVCNKKRPHFHLVLNDGCHCEMFVRLSLSTWERQRQRK